VLAARAHTVTPAKVRDLAGRIIQDWQAGQDQRTAAEFAREPPVGQTVTGLSSCLAAAGQHAIQLLLAPAGGLVSEPGPEPGRPEGDHGHYRLRLGSVNARGREAGAAGPRESV
jgi:hypothetical protein